MMVRYGLAALCLVLGVGHADDNCLMQSQIEGVVNGAYHGRDAVVLRDRDGRQFLMHTSGWCKKFNFRTAEGSTSNCLKPGDWFVFYGDTAKYTLGNFSKPKGVRCIITKIELYDPAKEKAAPK